MSFSRTELADIMAEAAANENAAIREFNDLILSKEIQNFMSQANKVHERTVVGSTADSAISSMLRVITSVQKLSAQMVESLDKAVTPAELAQEVIVPEPATPAE